MELLCGVVHGRMIELEDEPGLPDGQQVTVAVQSVEVAVENVGGLPAIRVFVGHSGLGQMMRRTWTIIWPGIAGNARSAMHDLTLVTHNVGIIMREG